MAAAALLDPSEENLGRAEAAEQGIRAALAASSRHQAGTSALTTAMHAVEGAWRAFRPHLSTSTVRPALRSASEGVERDPKASLSVRSVIYLSVRADVGAWALGYGDFLKAPPFLRPSGE